MTSHVVGSLVFFFFKVKTTYLFWFYVRIQNSYREVLTGSESSLTQILAKYSSQEMGLRKQSLPLNPLKVWTFTSLLCQMPWLRWLSWWCREQRQREHRVDPISGHWFWSFERWYFSCRFFADSFLWGRPPNLHEVSTRLQHLPSILYQIVHQVG